jgi:hypothetical protein
MVAVPVIVEAVLVVPDPLTKDLPIPPAVPVTENVCPPDTAIVFIE